MRMKTSFSKQIKCLINEYIYNAFIHFIIFLNFIWPFVEHGLCLGIPINQSKFINPNRLLCSALLHIFGFLFIYSITCINSHFIHLFIHRTVGNLRGEYRFFKQGDAALFWVMEIKC